MSKRAEQRALEAYPENAVIVYGPYPTTEPCQIDDNKCYRDGFIKGYEQAEKDTVERACEWLIDRASYYMSTEAMCETLRRAMEEEQ